MEVVTSSKSESPANKPWVAANPINPELAKGLWKNWLESETVMDDAFEIFRYDHNGYSKRCPESAHLIGYPRKLDQKREWKSMDDSEKAPFISKALRKLFDEAEAWKIVYKNAKPRKKSKARKKREKKYCGNMHALELFRDEFCERYFKDNPNDKMSIQLFDAIRKEWCSLTNAERAVYVKKSKDKWMEREEVYKSLLSVVEVYRNLPTFLQMKLLQVPNYFLNNFNRKGP